MSGDAREIELHSARTAAPSGPCRKQSTHKPGKAAVDFCFGHHISFLNSYKHIIFAICRHISAPVAGLVTKPG
jgi:hypothetical protein